MQADLGDTGITEDCSPVGSNALHQRIGHLLATIHEAVGPLNVGVANDSVMIERGPVAIARVEEVHRG